MSVTTSVFPNLNTFRLGPEFCILFRKLQSTCKTYKRATLSERYPDLCHSLQINANNICQKNTKDVHDWVPMKDSNDDIPLENFAPTNNIIEVDDELTKIIYRYSCTRDHSKITFAFFHIFYPSLQMKFINGAVMIIFYLNPSPIFFRNLS